MLIKSFSQSDIEFMNARRLNEQEVAQIQAIVAPIAAEYTPNFPRNFCEVDRCGLYNIHTTGVQELKVRLIDAIQAAGFLVRDVTDSLEFRVQGN